jgi:outer membrane lipopolysaccharide assembly protein LptE/RlpB
MMRFHTIVQSIVAVVLAAGCGYVPVARRGEAQHDSAGVRILPVENQTAYRDISTPLHRAMRHHLRTVGIEIDKTDSGKASHLLVRVFDIAVETGALTVQRNREAPVNQKWQIHAMITLTDSEQETVLGPSIVSVSEYVSAPDSVTAEIAMSSQLRRLLLDRLAQDIAYRLMTFYSRPVP